ncbi:MAG: hydantoinase B/oxoprolinase family protein [Sedimentitalea sp.]|nr:hydantoinase B/oxoprolinase family protein [Sedimentitalea sp.]
MAGRQRLRGHPLHRPLRGEGRTHRPPGRLERHRRGPPVTGAGIDPITLAVLAGRMEQIADEMDATLFRSAFNPIIAEAHDASHGLYHAETGDTLVQGKSGLPIFVGVMSFAVKAVIDKAAETGGPVDGDIWIFNDAHMGGTHLSDMRLVRPYFRDGALFCYLASVGHWHDVGGAVPGNYNPAATDAFQEAFVLPPVRIARAGEMQTDIVDILMRNTRLPQSAMGDLNGQLGALDLGVRRMDELLDAYGGETIRAALAALSDRAEALMRAELSSLPDGRWQAEDFLDNDGITDVALPIRVALEISGDRLVLDFEGTAPRCAGPVNIALPTAVATAYVAIKHIFPALPANAGVMRPIELRIPEGSLLSAEFPAPVGGYTETILRMIDVIFSAAAQAAPERVVANAYGTINALSIAGKRGNGAPWVMFSFYGGGHGGSSEGDGLNHGNAPISTATIPPMEILEAAYPVMFRQWALRGGSAGAGTHRGGLGAVYEIELLEENAEAFLFGERGRFAPRGVAGGGEAALNVFSYEQEDGWHHPPMASKMRGIALRRGQAVRLETPGGGGYGPASARAPEAVARDVAMGYLGEEDATRLYGPGWTAVRS